jgi:hypothetical protein
MGKKRSPYSVHPGVAKVQIWIADLPEKTGRGFEQWLKLIRQQGPGDEKAARGWLKQDHGLGTNVAGWLAGRAYGKSSGFADENPEKYLLMAEQLVEKQYAGKKAALKPLYDKLLDVCLHFAKDVKACPCETIVPIYRHHVIAQIKPATNTRIDFGLALRDEPLSGKLKDTGGFEKKDRISRKIEVSSLQDINAELLKWLKKAYQLDEEKPQRGKK